MCRCQGHTVCPTTGCSDCRLARDTSSKCPSPTAIPDCIFPTNTARLLAGHLSLYSVTAMVPSEVDDCWRSGTRCGYVSFVRTSSPPGCRRSHKSCSYCLPRSSRRQKLNHWFRLLCKGKSNRIHIAVPSDLMRMLVPILGCTTRDGRFATDGRPPTSIIHCFCCAGHASQPLICKHLDSRTTEFRASGLARSHKKKSMT